MAPRRTRRHAVGGRLGRHPTLLAGHVAPAPCRNPSAVPVTPLTHHGGVTLIVLYVLLAAALAAGVTYLVLGGAARRVDDDVHAAVEDAMAEVRRGPAPSAMPRCAPRSSRRPCSTASSSAPRPRRGHPCRPTWRRRRTSSTPGSTRSRGAALRAAAARHGGQRAGHGQRPALRPGRRVAAHARRGRRHARRLDAHAARGAGQPAGPGQWGERMAEDVLRLAGFTEHVNYRKQTQVAGGTGRPDYTFDLPKGHVLYMDVKFPLASYLRYLEVGTDAERQAHLKRFLADVRAARQGAGQARVRPRGRPPDRRLRAAVPAQRAADRVHPRARSRPARRGAWPSAS